MNKKLLPTCHFTNMPNEIMDKWILELGDVEYKIVTIIARKTYGWGKIEDKLSISQLMKLTGFSKSPICRALKRLVEDGYIQKQLAFTDCGDKDCSTYSLNVVNLSGHGVVPLETLPVVPLETLGVVPLETHTKETNTKETPTKEKLEREEAPPPPSKVLKKEEPERKAYGPIVRLSDAEYQALLEVAQGDSGLLEAKILRMNNSESLKPPSKRYKLPDSHFTQLKAWLLEQSAALSFNARKASPEANRLYAEKRADELKNKLYVFVGKEEAALAKNMDSEEFRISLAKFHFIESFEAIVARLVDL